MESILAWLFKAVAGHWVVAGVSALFGGVLGKGVPTVIRMIAYQGDKIAGDWEATFTLDDLTGTEKIKLRQEGHRISGTIRTVHTRAGADQEWLDSKVVGEFRSEYLAAYYVPSDESRFGCGTFTLRLEEGGRRLKGRCVLQLTRDRSLREIDYVWKRAGV